MSVHSSAQVWTRSGRLNAHRVGGRRLDPRARRPLVSRQTGQVPGLGWSILDEPPTGTPGKVTKRIKSVEPVFTASTTTPGPSTNAWPCVYLVMTQRESPSL